MVQDYHVLTMGADDSVDDLMDQIMQRMKTMKRQMFDARPLPQNPTILTFASNTNLENNTDLWKDTCPVCRPLVRDLKCFCFPQSATFQDQNTFICWKIAFSELASALATETHHETYSGNLDEENEKDEGKNTRENEKDGEQQNSSGIVGQEKDQKNLFQGESRDSLDKQEGKCDPDGHQPARGGFCDFCAYFASLMFDDPMYTFSVNARGLYDFEIDDCCCPKAMKESKKVSQVAEKLSGFAEKYGPNAGFEFVIQPIDYDLEWQGFGKLRFQTYSHTPSIPPEDLINILGLRRELVLEIYGIPGQLSGDMPGLKYWPVSMDPETWVEAGKAWISQCTTSHKYCQTPVKGPLPSRIVEILDDENVCVVSGTGQPHDFYISLSYCWGGSQEFALTTDTMSDKAAGFNVSFLPSTLRDAISVAGQLGIKYVWIDSLCIIQDLEEDKQRELPRMAEYYKNSYLTICASTSRCTTPFLVSDGQCKNHPGSDRALVPLGLLMSPVFEVIANEQNNNANVGTKFSTDVIDYVLVQKEQPYFVSMEPISSRAWTFQERVLSPRILFFGGRLGWQCHTGQESAGGVDYWDDDAPNIDHRKIRQLFFEAQPCSSPTSGLVVGSTIAGDHYDTWYRAVEEYTRRDLTVKADKLPAISALARVFQNSTGDDYLAGLWRGDILRGLLWSTYPTLSLSKPPSWRAPSWSWAAHDNEVSYKGLPPSSSIPVARVLASTAVPLSNLAPLGEVGSGVLELEGPVLNFGRDMTVRLMQKENDLPKVEDNPETRYQHRRLVSSKNNTDPGCRDWQPPDGHIMLCLLAIPTPPQAPKKPGSSPPSVVPAEGASRQATDDQLESRQEKQHEEKDRNESTEHDRKEEAGISHDAEPLEKPGLSTSTNIGNNSRGYTIAGLVLGPVTKGVEPGEAKYERLARFTSIGVVIKDYRDLEKLVKKVSII